MRTILLFLVGILTTSISAQTTSIPDQGFEQALIDLGIDSDQTLNGQVLTSDVASVTSLDLSDWMQNTGTFYIYKIDGIEDFVNLEVLDISNTSIGAVLHGVELEDPPRILDLSNLTNLEELNMETSEFSGPYIQILIVDNNPNLNLIEAVGHALEIVRLKGGDLAINNLDLYLGDDYFGPGTRPSVCVEVTNASQANNQQGTYANWTAQGAYHYSETCTLSSEAFNKIDVQLFPNPATEHFQLKTNEEIKSLTVYSLNGKEILKFQNQNTYDVSQLPAGIYFVKMETLNGTGIQKLIKN
ncbi:T9SS type A sorting domain-containing protein [Mesonia sp. K4-1]|uniref:T9SS type A sorting domain-containing protein n=1 Tax=Mesonia sp. K4-1 TaxID=2602760 RepID=UPI0011C745E4|nr:T9SS type A sorting domain-containing protein [Mesonia sp. K4-1]TXK73049.1 T9SS type A sorting domain-containing protein [Mesonia sp. K4-1]